MKLWYFRNSRYSTGANFRLKFIFSIDFLQLNRPKTLHSRTKWLTNISINPSSIRTSNITSLGHINWSNLSFIYTIWLHNRFKLFHIWYIYMSHIWFRLILKISRTFNPNSFRQQIRLILFLLQIRWLSSLSLTYKLMIGPFIFTCGSMSFQMCKLLKSRIFR